MPPKKGKKKQKKEAVDPSVQRIAMKRIEIKRELKIQDIMRTTLARKWHTLVLNLKIPAMKDELLARRAVFDRVMSKKQCVVDEIFKQKRLADDQSRLSYASATEITDQTIKRFGELLEKMKSMYEKERDEILKKGGQLKAADTKMWDNEENRMSTIKWADSLLFNEKYDQIYGEGVVKHYEMENLLKADLEDTEDKYENLFSNILEEYRGEIKDYNEKTADNRLKSMKLKEKDDIMCKILISQEKKLGESQKVIEDHQAEARLYDDGSAMAKIRERFNKYKGDYNEARFKLEKDMQHDFNQFTYLVEKSNDAISWLESMVKKSEKIIRAMNMCELLQVPTEAFSSLQSAYRCSCGDNKLFYAEDIEVTDNLKYLFSLMVEADVTTRALNEERKNLKEENDALLKHIKKWMKSLKH